MENRRVGLVAECLVCDAHVEDRGVRAFEILDGEDLILAGLAVARHRRAVTLKGQQKSSADEVYCRRSCSSRQSRQLVTVDSGRAGYLEVERHKDCGVQ